VNIIPTLKSFGAAVCEADGWEPDGAVVGVVGALLPHPAKIEADSSNELTIAIVFFMFIFPLSFVVHV
jgi:hypothetical protein